MSCKLFLRIRPRLSLVLRNISVAVKAMQATMRRQKAIVNASTDGRSLMKIAAVPKNTPAVTPSKSASFRVLACM